MKNSLNKKIYAKVFVILFFTTIAMTVLTIINSINIQRDYRNCRGIAIFCKQYYNVFIVTKETDTCYEYYYKSIKVKETNDAYYTIMIDWRTETEERHVLSKNQYVVVVSY